jgi:hypothetical protein
MLLLPVMNLPDVTVEGVLGAENDFTIAAVKLFRPFVNLIMEQSRLDVCGWKLTRMSNVKLCI